MVPSSPSMVMDAFEKWLRAVQGDDFSAARTHAKNLVRSGELLILHPDFRRCFAQHYPEVEPKDALLHVCQFMVCATDGRAQVLRKNIAKDWPTETLDDPGER